MFAGCCLGAPGGTAAAAPTCKRWAECCACSKKCTVDGATQFPTKYSFGHCSCSRFENPPPLTFVYFACLWSIVVAPFCGENSNVKRIQPASAWPHCREICRDVPGMVMNAWAVFVKYCQWFGFWK